MSVQTAAGAREPLYCEPPSVESMRELPRRNATGDASTSMSSFDHGSGGSSGSVSTQQQQAGKRLHLCTVGKKPSAATCYLNDPAEVLELLGTLGKRAVSVRANRFSLNDLSSISGYSSGASSHEIGSPRSPGSVLSPTSSPLGGGGGGAAGGGGDFGGFSKTSSGGRVSPCKDESTDSLDDSAHPGLTPLGAMSALGAGAGGGGAPTGMGARSFSMTALASMGALQKPAIPHSTSTNFQQFMENIAEEDDEEDDEGGIFF